MQCNAVNDSISYNNYGVVISRNISYKPKALLKYILAHSLFAFPQTDLSSDETMSEIIINFYDQNL